VTDAIFRSRWEGLQADLPEARSAAALSGLRPGDPGYSYAEGIANSLLSGLKLGPLDIHPGLSLGWEYSNQKTNQTATSTKSSADSSFFIAPTLALNYSREIGPWSVLAAYGAGIRYYLDPNYTAAATGNQRNPFTQTASFSIGHLGDRHKLTLSGTGSSGSGFDTVTGTNTIQSNLRAAIDYRYTLFTYVDVGANGAYSLQMNQNGQNGNTGSGTWATTTAGFGPNGSRPGKRSCGWTWKPASRARSCQTSSDRISTTCRRWFRSIMC
jgi:hypothetical protein